MDIESEPARHLLLVIGPGRSGTSVLTGIFASLGYRVPQPEVPPDPSNPRGFFEPQWAVDFHTRLLERVEIGSADARPSAWLSAAAANALTPARRRLDAWLEAEFAESPLLVVKDPRMLWFLSLWRDAAEARGARVSMIMPLRHPAETVASRDHWYGAQRHPSSRLAGWVNSTLFTERATRSDRRGFVAFRALIDDWTIPIDALCEALDIEAFRTSLTGAQVAASRLIEPELVRSHADWETLGAHPGITRIASDVWDQMLRFTTPEGADLDALDRLRAEYLAMYEEAAALTSRWKATPAQKAARQAEKKASTKKKVKKGNAGAGRAKQADAKKGRTDRDKKRKKSKKRASRVLATIRRAPAPMRRIVPLRLRKAIVGRLRKGNRP
jgi:hypothetical protein